MLKIVRVPISIRVGPTLRIAPWWRWADMKHKPTSSNAACRIEKSASTLMPNALCTSVVPDFEEAARLPCLAMGTPQPATTKVAAVEIFNVPVPSPPVPTMSMASDGGFSFLIRSRITITPPVISFTLSPRTRRAIKKAPICDGVAFPDIMMSKAVRACSTFNELPSATRAINALKFSS